MATNADSGSLRPVNHDRRVPPHVSADAALDELVAGELGFVLGRDGVQVVRLTNIGHPDFALGGEALEFKHEVTSARWPRRVDDAAERIAPFGSFGGIGIEVLAGQAAAGVMLGLRHLCSKSLVLVQSNPAVGCLAIDATHSWVFAKHSVNLAP